ncbi:OprD family outer membrane porin [Halotalea alkalilenta]|uniref:OprD family outer membrane porin n=1 Tax=Halotalea alkalilenta TaxID=376489 RepID=UPI000694EAB7|nr:OprD family outer membrane porin [Halotalea alkalilenta]
MLDHPTSLAPRCLLAGLALLAAPALVLAQTSDATDPNQPTPESSQPDPAMQQQSSGEARDLTEMFTLGEFHGALRSLYYSTHNAYFTPGQNQDTISYGGFVGFTSARYQGFRFGLSGILQRGIDHADDPSRVVTELGPNQTNIGEAYLEYQRDAFTITAGNQRLDLPFAGTWDWRVTPNLFQAVDLRYGDQENYLEATRVFRYMPWAGGSFTKTTMYNSRWDSFSPVEETTDGMWSIGGARALYANGLKWSGEAWHQEYEDYTKINYLEGQVALAEGDLRPFLGLQFMRGTGDGKELLGEVDSRIYGLQLGLNYGTLKATLNYNHIPAQENAYRNGVLVTPYAHNSSSGPIFAQPFFTSTQDLGAGNAYSLDVSGLATDQLVLGARYSFMDLKESSEVESRNQSEYMGFAVYNFRGSLDGFSVANFLGVQRSPRDGKEFWQNRLALQYAF